MLQRAALAFVVGCCLVRGLAGCGGTAVLQCKIEAVKMLPDDPMQLTDGDVADLTVRLHACKAQGDAGAR